MSDVVSYKCPNCAAGLGFDIERQSWHCNFCQGDFSLQDLQAADPEPEEVIPSSTPFAEDSGPEADLKMDMGAAHWEQPNDHFGAEAVAFSCPSCGGHIVTDANTAATFCAFCHNPTVLAARLENDFRPARMIPFKIQKDEVVTALNKLCHKRPLLPADFKRYAQKGEVTGLYVPFWLFDADMDAALSGTAKRITAWADRNYRYTKTDTYRVERQANLLFRGVPADGSTKMDDTLMDSLEPFDYSQMVDFSMQYLSGHFAESYDIPADDAARRAMNRMRDTVTRMLRSDIKGYNSTHIRSLTSTAKSTKNTYVMLPVWTLMAEYNGKTYTFAMNGQTGKITGSLPMSQGRLWSMFGKVAGIAAAAIFVGGYFI